MECLTKKGTVYFQFMGLLLVLFGLACNRSHSSPTLQPFTETGSAFLKDTIYSGVSGLRDKGVSYSLLLPSTYDPSKKHPLFLFLDPHGDGALPLNNYKDLASIFDAVFIGANHVKNGMPMEESIGLVKSVLADVVARVSIDEHAVFLVGFSGGARLAGSMVAQGFPVAGVIACSAGMPHSPTLIKIPVGLVAGLDDANLAELFALEDAMHQRNSMPGMYCFSGGHAWSPDSVMKQALRRLVFKHQGADLPAAWRLDYEADFARKAACFTHAHDALALHRLCEERKQFVLKNQSEPNDSFYKVDETNQQNGALDAAQRRWQKIFAEEEQCKNKYMLALNTQDVSFCQEELLKLRTEKNVHEDIYHMNQRLLGWLGLALYSLSKRTVEATSADAERYVTLYHLLEPLNAEADYLRAVLMARKGASSAALFRQLQLAIEHGFAEPERMLAEKAFVGVLQLSDFQQLRNGIKGDLPH